MIALWSLLSFCRLFVMHHSFNRERKKAEEGKIEGEKRRGEASDVYWWGRELTCSCPFVSFHDLCT